MGSSLGIDFFWLLSGFGMLIGIPLFLGFAGEALKEWASRSGKGEDE